MKAGDEWDSKLRVVSSALEKWIPNGITVTGHPKASTILDTINASL
jgi:hypothetical protein